MIRNQTLLPPSYIEHKNHAHMQKVLSEGVQYVLKRVSFGSKDCTKELKPECAYFLGQTS